MAEYTSMFNDYPVTITAEELTNELDLNIAKEYPTAFLQRSFMNDVHSAVYEGGIYATGDRTIKNLIINQHKGKGTDATYAIKRALVLQASYMHSEGNIGTSSGIAVTADGQRAVISRNELRGKALCIAAFDALKACPIPIMYCGE